MPLYENHTFDYTFHQQTFENLQSVKYFGIAITENMELGHHISDISSNAANLASVPKRTNEVA